MIHIEKDQKIYDDENLRVVVPTGDYDDYALIEFYDINNPDVISGSFQAQYIKYGSMVYKFNDHKELGEGILKIDPESTHTAASFVRMSNELLAQMNAGSLEPTSLNEALASEQIKMEEQVQNPPELNSSTNDLLNDTGTNVSDTSSTTPTTLATTTESINAIADEVSTTTEAISEILEAVVDSNATSTPQ